ncbi:MAG: ArsA family ATPase [Candidatus Hatepunaea meridiana]|nr:ArsA family ATPase [Candidatus Hatepunaea meridiana]
MLSGGLIPTFLKKRGLRLILFSGKGGAGKTTCAAATAIQYAQNCPQDFFLIASTDPAHSLMDSFAGNSLPQNLKLTEIDAQILLTDFKKKHNAKFRKIASRGTFLDDADINQFLDISLPGMDELMAFLEIIKWIEDGIYDCIIVDTAPTGHTLRLLEMPQLIRKWIDAMDSLLAKHRYMKKLFSGFYRKDEIDEFLLDFSASINRMETLLQDPVTCQFVPVMLAEELSIHETGELINQLSFLKIPVNEIIVNKLYPKNKCRVCAHWRKHQIETLQFHIQEFTDYSLWGIPLNKKEIRGTKVLETFWGDISEISKQPSDAGEPNLKTAPKSYRVEGSRCLPTPETKFMLFAGKGGVGKTTLASATAVRLACEFTEKKTFIFSTDPAHSLSVCFDKEVGSEPKELMPGLIALEIDAQSEFRTLKEQYSEELENFLKTISPNVDFVFDREVMSRIMDVSPPGLDEIMALTRAIEFITKNTYDYFILDSAPTGHLLRLLELPQFIEQWLKTFFNLFLKYKNVFKLPEIMKKLVQMSKDVKYLRELLIDPARSKLYVVTILTEMAFEETKDLVSACERMSIGIPSMLINMATPSDGCDLCNEINAREFKLLHKYFQTFTSIPPVMIYRNGEPRGLEQLQKLGDALYWKT